MLSKGKNLFFLFFFLSLPLQSQLVSPLPLKKEDPFKKLLDSCLEEKVIQELHLLEDRETPQKNKIYHSIEGFFIVVDSLINNHERFAIVGRMADTIMDRFFYQGLLENTLDTSRYFYGEKSIDIPVVKFSFKKCGLIRINNEKRADCIDREINTILSKKLTYPDELAFREVSGTVLLKCMIDEGGKLSDIIVLESPHPLLSEISLRAVKKLKSFTPSILRNGKRVASFFILPITFGQ